MIYDIFQIILWITAVMLFISGVDDLYLDLLYWFERGKYRRMLPDFTEMFQKGEKPIAVFIGAWNESAVIGRTLSYAVRNLNYKNYRFFIGVYPNDPDTLKIVQGISQRDPRIIPCVNTVDGPTTKADNLNLLYAALIEYEKEYGKFEIILVHDAEDFIHPNSFKLYNLLLGYKGYHAIQIPVIPIKSKLGKLFHRTYCDAFAEVHTKDMIVRQAMGTFIPFAGTGMGFHRKTFNYLEKHNIDRKSEKYNVNGDVDPFNTNNKTEVVVNEKGEIFSKDDMTFNNDDNPNPAIDINDTEYYDDPFHALNGINSGKGKTVSSGIKGYTFMFLAFVIGWIAFLVYSGNTDNNKNFISNMVEKVSISPSDAKAENNGIESLYAQDKLGTEEIINVSNGYADTKYNVLYTSKGGKFLIQESSYNNAITAEKRIAELQQTGLFSGKSLEIQSSINGGTEVYRVIISSFNSLEEARIETGKFKKPVK